MDPRSPRTSLGSLSPSDVPDRSGSGPILAAWWQVLRRAGPAPAVFSERGEVLRTFAQIEAEAREWSAAFAGLEAGSVVALQPGNGPEWPALFLAALRSRLVALPLGRHTGETERAAALETCCASALVEREGHEGDDGCNRGRLRLLALPHHPPAWEGDAAPDLLKLTSGTTSAPRAIRFRQGQLLEDCLQICETMGFGPEDLNYAVIPLSHSYGFSNLLTPLLCRGVPFAVSEDRMPRAILDGLAATGASVFPGMPVLFDKLAALAAPPALPRLRLCIAAGAPLSPETGERFSAQFGVKIHPFYGSSECGGIAYDASPDPVYRDGFVGCPMARVRVAPGENGAITVESAAVGDGYWPPEEGRETLGCGRFTPGDLVRCEAEGLFLAGRVSDVINIAGRKLNPREVEAQLLRFPGVREAVVFGVPSPLRHEEAVACIAGEIAAGELLRFARSCLSGWQTPREIWVVAEIPRNERGKISRRELAERYATMRGSC